LDFFSVHEKDGDLWITSRPSEWVPDEVFNPLLKKAMELGGGYDSLHRAVRIPVEAPVAVKASEPRDAVFQRADRLDKQPEPGPREIQQQPEKKQKPTSDELPNVGDLVALKLLSLDPKLVRETVDEEYLNGLAQSIHVRGLIQPLVVRARPDGAVGYLVVAGEQRYRAAEKAGLVMVPVSIRKLNDREAFETSLMENIQRMDLPPIEIAHRLKKMQAEWPTVYSTQEALGRVFGKGQNWVSRHLAMLELEPIIPRGIIGKVTERQAAEIRAAPEEKRADIIKSIKETGEVPSTREIQAQAKPSSIPSATPPAIPSATPSEERALVPPCEACAKYADCGGTHFIMAADGSKYECDRFVAKGERESEQGFGGAPAEERPAGPSAPAPRQTTSKLWHEDFGDLLPEGIILDIDNFILKGGAKRKRAFVPCYLEAMYAAAITSLPDRDRLLTAADRRLSDLIGEAKDPTGSASR
jgi:ParB family chromosome partitioning protein